MASLNLSALSVVVLTGGQATRMWPLTLDRSKPMMPFMGRPLLEHLFEDLASAALSRLILTHPGRNGDIRQYFGSGAGFGVDVQYLEPKPWAVRQAWSCRYWKLPD